MEIKNTIENTIGDKGHFLVPYSSPRVLAVRTRASGVLCISYDYDDYDPDKDPNAAEMEYYEF